MHFGNVNGNCELMYFLFGYLGYSEICVTWDTLRFI